MSIAQRATNFKVVPGGRSSSPASSTVAETALTPPPASPPEARDGSPQRAAAGTGVPQLVFPPDGISLLLPPSIEKRIANAVLARKLEWPNPIKLEYGKDLARIQLIRSGQDHLVLMYFDASQDAAKWPTWYLSSVFVRVWRKLRNDKCNRPPSVVLLVNDESLAGRWQFESQMWQQAGLIKDCRYDLLGEWDDSAVNDKVNEWATQLQDSRSQASIMLPSGNASALLGTPSHPNRYFVFVASPGDTTEERDEIRRYFRNVSERKLSQGVDFEVLDWERFSSARAGDPQQNIFEDVLRPEYEPLVLVIIVLKHKLGGDAHRESGTKKEFEWALERHQKGQGSPEIKCFFCEQGLSIPTELTEQQQTEAWNQFRAVQAFRQEIKSSKHLCVSYKDKDDFTKRLDEDLGKWLEDSKRPWNARTRSGGPEQPNVGWTTSD